MGRGKARVSSSFSLEPRGCSIFALQLSDAAPIQMSSWLHSRVSWLLLPGVSPRLCSRFCAALGGAINGPDCQVPIASSALQFTPHVEPIIPGRHFQNICHVFL